DRISPRALQEKLDNDGKTVWLVPEAVPTLVQLLQAEDKPLRLLLVKLLSKIQCRDSSLALAKRACFDVAEEVREEAVAALRKRPGDEYVDFLMDALRYPWPAAADFAAEALVNTGQSAALPALIKLLDEPDPAVPTTTRVGEADVKVIRELVRVNHLKNCMLCHAPSLETTDLVRGLIPDPRQPLPPSFSPQYYGGNSLGGFVRADITYLKQDFAVPQLVANHGPWPAHQRFDYMVRTRPLPAAERIFREPKKGPVYPQRDAVLFALKELTGEDHGLDADGWNQALQRGLNDAGKRVIR
ncbi:MAG: HEAT repeat domain-containing protein, partial [Gemmataceae bacterium]